MERVTVMARFMDSTPLRNNFPLQSVLTNAFCYLISSMDDFSEIVAQRATLLIGTIHDYAMRVRHCLLFSKMACQIIFFIRSYFVIVINYVPGDTIRLCDCGSTYGASIVVSAP